MSLSGLLSSSFILLITVTILLILVIITIICNEKKDVYDFFRLHQPAAYYGVNSRPLENSQVLREIKKLSKFTMKQLSTYVTEIVKK